MNLLQILADRHTEWIRMAQSFNVSIDNDKANDYVQEMYLRLHKYIDTPERIMFNETEINTCYVYVTLRNIHFSDLNNSKKFDYLNEVSQNESIDDLDVDLETKTCELQDEILNEIGGWRYYDNKLAKLILLDKISMRKLSRETGISLYSIKNSVDNYKEILNNKFKNKYSKL